MTQNLFKPGGHAHFLNYQQVQHEQFIGMSQITEQSLWDGLASGLFAGRDGFIGQGCKPGKGGGGDLDWTVEAGMGVITLSGGDFEPDTTPLFVPTQLTGTLAAHDGANPRIDIVSLAPLIVEDIPSGQLLYVGGSFVPTPINTRARRSYAVTVTQGTPAAGPVAPATPAGNLLVGLFGVPAVSGPITVGDYRQLTGIASEAQAHRPWKPEPIALTAKAASKRTVTIRIFSLEGNPYTHPEGWPADPDQRYHMRARVFDNDYVTDPGQYRINAPTATGVNVTAIDKAEMIVKTGAGSGIFDLTIEDVTTAYTGTLYLSLTPILYYDSGLVERGKGGVPVTIELDWA